MTLLDVQRLSVSFGAVRACDEIDLCVNAGELIGVVGPNGSGKTTFFRAICGDIGTRTGRVIWQGRDITGWSTDRIARQGLVRTWQQSMAFASATVRENLQMGMACAAGRRSDASDALMPTRLPTRLGEVLEYTGLDDVADTPAGALPTGLLRILGIALALAARPAMLLLDEPAAGLSVPEAVLLTALLRQVQASGVALAVVDHDVSFLLPLCQRLVVLNVGRKLMEGPPTVVAAHEDVVRVYLGERFRHGKVGSDHAAPQA